MNFLGIDLGTSAVKAIVVDGTQEVIAQATVPLQTSRPREGWSEQAPDDWWAAVQTAVAKLRETSPQALGRVRGLGLSGQMHGAVAVDAAGVPVRPAILWNDARASAECGLLAAAVADIGAIAGVMPMPGFTAPKLLWMRRHEPQHFRRIHKVLSPKDYIRLQLTGDSVTDMSDAAGTLWLDEARRDWSDPVLAASGLERSHMPRLVEGSLPAGEVRGSLLRAWGMRQPVTVAGGAGDVAAAAVGLGAVRDGEAFISLGTSAQFFVTDNAYRPQPQSHLHAFAHALPQRWFRMAAMLNGASCLEWVGRVTGEADIGALIGRVEPAWRGPSRLLFLPYLSGERTPHNDPHARGVFAGLDASVTPLDLAQAAMEGVAFSLLEAQRQLEAAGLGSGPVAATGGGARSRFWMQLTAHVLGRGIMRHAGSGHGPAFGAARLARLASTGEAVEAVCSAAAIEELLEPDASLHAAYGERFERFRELYAGLRSEFAARASRP